MGNYLYKDNKITPITGLKEHNTNKEIEAVLSNINSELYFFSNLPVNYRSQQYLLEKVTEAGKQLNTISITRETKQLNRRKEILEKLRELYTTLKHLSYPKENEIPESVTKANKYLVAVYLKEKKEGLDLDTTLKWVKKIYRFSKFYEVTESLENVQNELLKSLRVFKEETE